MRRLRSAVLFGGLLAMCSLVSPAQAHRVPSQRSVVVQVEDGHVAILVTWTASSGPHATLMYAHASLGRERAEALKAAKAMAASRALAPLIIKLDGKPLTKLTTRTKLTTDPSGSGRPAVAVLITAPIPPGRHTLTVDVAEGQPSPRIMWTDRSTDVVKVVGSPAAAGSWARGLLPLTLTWRPPK